MARCIEWCGRKNVCKRGTKNGRNARSGPDTCRRSSESRGSRQPLFYISASYTPAIDAMWRYRGANHHRSRIAPASFFPKTSARQETGGEQRRKTERRWTDEPEASQKWTRMWKRRRRTRGKENEEDEEDEEEGKKREEEEGEGERRGGGERRLQGQMVQRSYHCLLSDSDKFTIKLHSFPSKCLSSVCVCFIFLRFNQSSILSRSHSRLLCSVPRPRRSTLASDDNHNSLRTRASSASFLLLLPMGLPRFVPHGPPALGPFSFFLASLPLNPFPFSLLDIRAGSVSNRSFLKVRVSRYPK